MDGRLVRVRDLTAKPVPESSSRPGSMGDFGGSVGPVISVLSLPCSGRRPPPIGAAEAACHSDGNPILFKKDCPGKPRVRGAVAACPRIYGQGARQRQVLRSGILQRTGGNRINRRPTRPGARPRPENRPSPPLRNRQTKTPGRDCRALVQGRVTLGERKILRRQSAWSPFRRRPSRGRRSAPRLPRPASRPCRKSCGFRRRPWRNWSSTGCSAA